MSLNSINTNVGAQVALQSLNMTNSALANAQNQVSTGLKISTAKDNGAVWAIAQNQKSQVSALSAVTDSLNNGQSVLDTTVSAGSQLTDILNQMQQKALAATDTGISDTSRTEYQSEFTKLAQTYANVIASASFNGVNLIDTSSGGVSALGSADGTVKVSSAHNALDATSVFGATAVVAVTKGTATPTSAPSAADTVATGTAWTGTGGVAAAQAALTKVGTALTSVTTAMSGFGVDSKAMGNQLTLVSNLTDSLNAGIGNLVDADVAAESATLQALQTKQQLGIQALSIANSSSSNLLSLFRG